MARLPELYLHVQDRTRWANHYRPGLARSFTLVNQPRPAAALLSVGADAIASGASCDASRRFALLLPADALNGERSREQRKLNAYDQIFVNPGPLSKSGEFEGKLMVVPQSVFIPSGFGRSSHRSLDSLLHISNDFYGSDWRRSESVMIKSRLAHRVVHTNPTHERRKARSLVRKFDGFLHIARDRSTEGAQASAYSDSFILAGACGAIMFWHDTWKLGKTLESVFELPLDTRKAADTVLTIRSSVDLASHRQKTHEEFRDVFNPAHSIALIAARIKELL